VLDTGETALDLLSGGPGDEVLFTLGDGRVLVGGIVPADLWVKGFNAWSLGMTVGVSSWVYVRARQRDRQRARAFVVGMEKSETKRWGRSRRRGGGGQGYIASWGEVRSISDTKIDADARSCGEAANPPPSPWGSADLGLPSLINPPILLSNPSST
jgi:hypothetical protein